MNTLRSRVSDDRAVHLFHCARMVYMFGAPKASSDICTTGVADGMVGALQFPILTLTLTLAVVLVGCGIKDLLGELPDRRYSHGIMPLVAAAPSASERSIVACRITIGLTMAFMLVLMS